LSLYGYLCEFSSKIISLGTKEDAEAGKILERDQLARTAADQSPKGTVLEASINLSVREGGTYGLPS
jgi:hypothetical protein